MGKPTGFLEYERRLPEDRPVFERVRDWGEFRTGFGSEEEKRRQGGRCMDCGIPFCHSGILYDGAVSGCPIHNLIPEWNDLIFRGRWKAAYERLRKTNNFPEFTGRVCPAPCEGACTAGINDPPIAIKHNEWAIAARAWEEGWVAPRPPAARTGKRVAVVGSGPAGLACADQLNSVGHEVTVYERADRIGGLLAYGIPNMKLDKDLVRRRIGVMEEEGVVFLTGIEVGRDMKAEKLLAGYDAVVLCGGATKPRDLDVPGRAYEGIAFAVDFLAANTKTLLDSNGGNADAFAAGKDVAVIGGGDTGTDCVATVIRQGCRSVVQLEILPEPPRDRPADNPWPRWPKTLKVDYGQEESIELYGRDPRTYLVTAKEFSADQRGRVKELVTVGVEWKAGANGRLAPVAIGGSEIGIPAQLVLIAMGFLGPEDGALSDFGVERDARSNAKAEFGKYATNVPKVFAAGDMRRGQSLVVWAIEEGRGAAREVDRYLTGETRLP